MSGGDRRMFQLQEVATVVLPSTPELEARLADASLPNQVADRVRLKPRVAGDRCRCPACGEYFNSTRSFDAHRVGRHGPERRCLTAAEMQAKSMLMNTAGFWITGQRPVDSLPPAKCRGEQIQR